MVLYARPARMHGIKSAIFVNERKPGASKVYLIAHDPPRSYTVAVPGTIHRVNRTVAAIVPYPATRIPGLPSGQQSLARGGSA
jgi:hypothetical protein